MAITVKGLAHDVQKMTLTYGDEEMKLKYRPGLITSKRMKAADEARYEGEMTPFYEFMVELVVHWDLEDGEGEMAEISVETFEELPLPFVGRMFSKIMEHAEDMGDDPKSSKDGSRRKVS